MKHSLHLLFAFVLGSLFVNAPLQASEREQLFSEANIAYQAEDYTTAIAQYQSLLAISQSANVHFNLANTYFKIADYGLAIFHYRKALILDPSNPDYRANLAFAQQAAKITQGESSLLARYAMQLSVNTWAWIGAISFWSAVALAVLPRVLRWRGLFPITGFSVSFCITLATGLALLGYHGQSQEGIVLTAQAPLKVAPVESVDAKDFLSGGESASIEEQKGNYYLVSTASGKSGWISTTDFGKIWE